MFKNNIAKIALLLVAAVTRRTAAFPQPAGIEKVSTSGNSDNTPSIDLPFLQFKNGGVRVNFAGYHAEAGLGGLLGGSDAKGGLYASAGTPWGPSASAGLGGALGGKDGSARGGLHARAGLGNGGPEAAAGLGGNLDGSGRSGSRARGGLYAGATAGGPQAVAGLGGSIDESGGKSGSSYASATNGRKTKIAGKDFSNIQPIAPTPTAGEKVYLAKSGVEEPSTTLEFKLPGSNEKKAVASSLIAGELENPGPKYDVEGPNGVAAVPAAQDIVEVLYPARRYYRKRLRNGPVKQAFYKYLTTNTGTIDDVPAQSATFEHPGAITTRQAIDYRPIGYVDAPHGVAAKPKDTTLFDNIFNIPISVLAAVNQLLNNKSG